MKLEWCGPAIIQTILNFNGVREDQGKIAEDIWNKNEKVAKLSEMVYYPQQKGLESYSFRADVQILKQFLSQGIPVIVFQKASRKVKKGHYRLVVGYNDESIIFYDSLFGKTAKLKEKGSLDLWNFGGEECWAEVVIKDDASVDDRIRHNEIYYRDMARSLFRRGRFDQSSLYWEKALEEAERATYFYSLAFTYLQEGDLLRAEEYAQKALTKEPDNPF